MKLNSIIDDSVTLSFVIFMGVLFLIFLVCLIIQYYKSRIGIKWIDQLLQGVTSDNVASQRFDLKKKAENDSPNSITKNLWLEFNETLVEINEDETTRLYNTFDSTHFFNSNTLAGKITNNRLMSAVPGFLTAVGVIGTFWGLIDGLEGLNLSGDVSIEEMKKGIGTVIDGAKTAFITSIVGVTLGVVFNLGEKAVEQHFENRIARLQIKIDRIFPRKNPEDQLQLIVQNSLASREALQGLAEKIGSKMQETMQQATQGMSDTLAKTLTEIMAPAINKLVDTTSEGNQKALEGLLEKFMDGFGAKGEEQRMAMNNASEKVNQSIDEMKNVMQNFVSDMKNAQSTSQEREKLFIDSVSEKIATLSNNNEKQNNVITEEFEKNLKLLGDLFNKKEQGLSNHSDKLHSQTNEFIEKIQAVTEKQQAGAEAILMQAKMLNEKIEEVYINHKNTIQSLGDATNGIKDSSQKMANVSENLRLSGEAIQETGKTLSSSMQQILNGTKEITKVNEDNAQIARSMHKTLLEDLGKFDGLLEKFTALVQTTETTFDGLKSSQKEYLDSLSENVNNLRQKMQEALENYAEKANGQTGNLLRVWQQGTNEYTENMRNAVASISQLVEEIDEKIGNINK